MSDEQLAHKWEKVLWKEQPFPDNYVPKSFLSSLRRNANFRPYTYSSVVLESLAVTQHISVIFIFLAVFVRLNTFALDPRLLVWASICTFIVGYIMWEISEPLENREGLKVKRVKAIKSSILVFFALIALSPVLKTLSEATSSDSIWALSASLFILNALLADYRSENPLNQGRERLTSVLSMNAAISASVVLASRLKSNLSVFALVLFSVQSFALFPLLRKRLQSYCQPFTRALHTFILATLSIHLIFTVSVTVGSILTLILMFVNFGAPALLVWAQRYKNEIRGSWDVAVPQVQ